MRFQLAWRAVLQASLRAGVRVAVAAWAGLASLLGTGALAQPSPPHPCPPPLPSAEAPLPADRGLLWRISRDGRDSWLYGTLHVGRPAWRQPGPRLDQALRAADVLALELDPSDPAVLAALSETQPAPALDPASRHLLDRAFERACLAPQTLAALHPALQATTLMLLEARWLGLDPAYAQESLLAAQARAAGKPVLSLETAAQQKAVLVPEQPEELRLMIEQTLAQIVDGGGRRVLQRLVAAWEQGDLAALENYEAWCECAATEAERRFLRRLNDERNPPLADGIAAQHAQGRRVLAAIGALHMTGPQALPRLLAQRGFRVERVH